MGLDASPSGGRDGRQARRSRAVTRWTARSGAGATDRSTGGPVPGLGRERLGREWETGDPGGPEQLRSADEERYAWSGRGGDERFRRDWDERGFREAPRDHGERRFRDSGRDRDVVRSGHRDLEREDLRASPSGAFHEELREERGRPRRYDVPRDFGEVRDSEGRHMHYNLAGVHDLGDLSDLRALYREHRRHLDHPPRYGHGPGVENMAPPRLGYGTSMTRRGTWDHELGHGGFSSDVYREGLPRPTGRPPKGYTRSDDRIREDICDRLMMSWMNAENVEVRVLAGEVTLQGTVKSRDEKRAIEALAESVLGVKDITNALRIERREQDQEQTSVQPPGDTPLHS
jgi:BON domain